MDHDTPPTAVGTHRQLADVLRGLTAAGVLLSAVVHLDMYASGFGAIAIIGPLFLLNTAAGLILGVAVLVWRHPLPALLAAGFGAVTAAAYWYSVLFGLFGVREVIGGWSEILAEVAEYVALLAGLSAAALLHRGRRVRATAPRSHPARPERPVRMP